MPAAVVLLGERCWYLPRKLAGMRGHVREGAPAPHPHRDGKPAPHARVAGALTE
jgi:hypothetical protein